LRVYRWQARQRNGKIVSGRMKAADPKEVALHVQARYGYVTSIKPVRNFEQFWLNQTAGALKLQEKEFLFRQLGLLLESGVQILRALDLVTIQASAPVVQLGKAIHQDLERGQSFSFSLSKRPRDFSPLVVKLIEAGEISGNLAFLFLQLAQYYQREKEVKKTVVTACLYPTLVILLTAFTVGYFLVQVLPVILELYSVLDVETTGFFQTLLFLVEGSRKNFYLLTVVLFMLVGFAYHKRSALQNLFLELPYFRRLYHGLWEARYCRILSLLLESGIPLVQGLQILTPLLPSQALRSVSLAINKAVVQGMPLSKAANIHAGIFGQLSTEFISLGEENGGLAAMLKEAADILEAELTLKLKRLKILLEPLLLLVLTLFLGGILYSLMTPIYGLMTGLPDY